MADKNKVYFGLENLHYAILDPTHEEGSPTWEEPLRIPGAVDLAPDAATNEYTFYADNGIYYATYSDNGYTADLETAKFPDTFTAAIFGWLVDGLGGILEVTDGQHKNFALMGEITGDIARRRFVYYNCAGGKPSSTAHTTEENVEVQTQTMPLTILPLLLPNGRKAAKYALTRDESNPEIVAAYDDFYKAVYIPTIIAAEPATLSATSAFSYGMGDKI